MKKILFLLSVLGLLACACALFAQGAFVDVPTDHWAYDAVNQLQRVGIIVGYPDGTFGGKRAMTRYEFAVAIARLLPLINGDTVISNDVDLSGYAKKSDIPAFSGASKGDLDALRKLINEFGDELASLGVDVDALKRDVANLTARVEALEAENRRVRFSGRMDLFAYAGKGNIRDKENYSPSSSDTGVPVPANNLLDNVRVLKNFDLDIVGRASDKVTVYSTINYGNFLSWFANSNFNANIKSTAERFYPYYLYAVADMGKATFTAGRFPLQWTSYTMMRSDWDCYSENIAHSDDCNYVLDGVKIDYALGSKVNLTAYAAKNNQNIYRFDQIKSLGIPQAANDTFVRYVFDQSAGARATFGIGKATLGTTYYEAWSSAAKNAGENYDRDRVFGADLKIPFGSFTLNGEWADSKLLENPLVGAGDAAGKEAYDVFLALGSDKLGMRVGYRDIDNGFATAGRWLRVGGVTNPTSIKGWYADAKWNLGSRFTLFGGFQDYDGKQGFPGDLTGYNAGLTYYFTSRDSLTGEFEDARDARTGIFNEARFTTITYRHKFGTDADLRLAYQFINNKTPLIDNHGGVAIAQFSVAF